MSVTCGLGARRGSCVFHTPSLERSHFWGKPAQVIQGFRGFPWVVASLEQASAGLAAKVVDGRYCPPR